MHEITIVILAAGASKRMGTTKQLLAYKTSNLLNHAISQAYFSKAKKVITVLGADHIIIKKSIDLNKTSVIYNRKWKNGLGSSISYASKHILKHSENPDHVLFMLADQPEIDTLYLNQLIDLFEKKPDKPAATQYLHSVGVPAVFPFRYMEILQNLSGDTGAKAVLNHPETHASVLNTGKEIIDIDTMKDWERFRASGISQNRRH